MCVVAFVVGGLSFSFSFVLDYLSHTAYRMLPPPLNDERQTHNINHNTNPTPEEMVMRGGAVVTNQSSGFDQGTRPSCSRLFFTF